MISAPCWAIEKAATICGSKHIDKLEDTDICVKDSLASRRREVSFFEITPIRRQHHDDRPDHPRIF